VCSTLWGKKKRKKTQAEIEKQREATADQLVKIAGREKGKGDKSSTNKKKETKQLTQGPPLTPEGKRDRRIRKKNQKANQGKTDRKKKAKI